MMKLLKNEDAFTGLEAAIVLIAFIVVAAVFSYVMLGAGFFATQEAQRTVHTGSQQASSSLEIIGNIYGKTGATTEASSANARLQSIEFTIGNTAGGSPIDITQMLVTFVCGETSEVIPFSETGSIKGIGAATNPNSGGADSAIIAAGTDGKWGVIMTYNDIGKDATGTIENRNKLLEPGEQFVLKVAFPEDAKLTPNTRFSVNLQPAIGAAFPIKKTVPSTLYAVNII
ncbi:archaellin/type IV pilin N-terminal domain-containing protein [Methanoculleus sp. UBA303]|mgnify:CR=1 FL=1|uniref:archaellin/type IV pilin N-terminal domain-containing protein n=1 Tax=Methanoculleus sp. UBA303 TaxID=1915497 RepID=UPI0025E4358E|nr:archaellin/type IV pilin N-terminal domain-containing protein [Methanoculleus sp. UBA303]